MRRSFIVFLPLLLLAAAWPASAATGRVMKVLPQFLDLNGRHALSPSLYDRDAYPAFLRRHTNNISGICFNVQWKAKAAAHATLHLRLELRGIAQGNLPRRTTLEKEVKPGLFSRWTRITLGNADYRNFGEVTAWRVTLWDSDRLVGEQKSFLW